MLRTVKGLIHHSLCQEYIFFCTDTKHPPSFLILIIFQAMEMANAIISVLKPAGWVVTASCWWNQHEMKAMK